MRLQTLGGLKLENSAFARPKPLLLLAFLSLEGPQPRRHIAELFWPDAADHMKSLTVALAQLRKGAPGAVEADHVSVKTTLETDAKAFEHLVDKGANGGALELYGGYFLEGLYLSWGIELEEWVYKTREYFAGRMRDALLACAETEAAQGNFAEAVAHADRAFKLEGAPAPEAEDLARMHTLMLTGKSRYLSEVREEATFYELPLLSSAEEARAKFRPTKTIKPTPSANLPLRNTSFVGRDLELTDLASLFETCRFVTILGSAGLGKTRLALQFAHEQTKLGSFKDSVHFLALDTLSSVQSIPSSLAESLGLSLDAKQPILDQVSAFLADKAMLLLFDNFEHLLEGASFISELLRACPKLKVLVTTRERLNLEEEQVFPLAGLPYPKDETVSPEDAKRFDAVSLFINRAKRARHDFDLSAELPHVLTICQWLEGLPLGLELAAAWVKVLPCQDIADEIEKNLDFLSTSHRNVPERHQSLRAAFDASWQRLTPKEQAVFSKLAVFRGGFRREAASEVAGASIPVLASLVDKSLLRVDATGRYDRHPLLYQYAREKLAEHPDVQAETQRNHATYYLALAEGVEPTLRGAEQADGLRRLEQEMDNFRAVLAWAEGVDDTLSLNLTGTLASFWTIRGYFQEGRAWLAKALSSPNAQEETAVRAKALLGASRLAYAQGDYAEVRSLLETCLTTVKALGNRHLLAQTLRQLGRHAHATGDIAGARTFYEQSLELSRALNDPLEIASSLNRLGILLEEQGSYSDARTFLEEAIHLQRMAGDYVSMSLGLNNLATLLHSLGDNAAARPIYEEALALYRQFGDRRSEALALSNLANMAAASGAYEQARSMHEESLRIRRELGNRRGIAIALHGLGNVAYDEANFDEARAFYEEGLAIARAVGERMLLGNALNNLARVLRAQEETTEAIAHYEEGLTVRRAIADKWGIAQSLNGLADVYIDSGNDTLARTLLLESLALRQGMNNKKGMVKALESLAALDLSLGKTERATCLFAAADNLRQRMDLSLKPKERQRHEEALTQARETLGNKAFENLWHRGLKVTLEEAIAYAKGERALQTLHDNKSSLQNITQN